MNKEGKSKQEFCQSKYFKNWNPDTLGEYNSVTDKHLKYFFKQPSRKQQLLKAKQLTHDGRVVEEKEWRRMNLEWERTRREAKEEEQRRKKQEEEERNNRLEIRQKTKQEEMDRKKVEDRRRKERENVGGMREAWGVNKKEEMEEKEMKKIVDMINYEIEYVLRPRTAPPRRLTAPNLMTSKRADGRSHSQDHYARHKNGAAGSRGYPRILGQRSASTHPLSPGGIMPVDHHPRPRSRTRGRSNIRNIEVPSNLLPQSSQATYDYRPKTAPVHRSPTRPHFKEEEYIQSKVVLRYAGHTEHKTEGWYDEVMVQQQPRGSYTLQVFKGYLAVGDEFWFTSRRVAGNPFSLTIFVNSVCHVRLSACCEKKRTVGARLGQGDFTLVSVQGAEPCIRCVMEEDPIAQKHLAKLAKFRGEYDEWGNRLTRTMINTRHLLEVPGETKQRKTRGRRKKRKEEKETTEQVHCLLEDNFTHPAKLTLSPPPRFKSVHRRDSLDYEESPKVKLEYRERFELEHTYAAMQGGRLHKEKQKINLEETPITPNVDMLTTEKEEKIENKNKHEHEQEYENDSFMDEEVEEKHHNNDDDEDNDYDNDSFIIEDDGGNNDGDLTESSASTLSGEEYQTEDEVSSVSSGDSH